MPHNRLQRKSVFTILETVELTDDSRSLVAPEIKWKGKRVEETVLAGWNASAVRSVLPAPLVAQSDSRSIYYPVKTGILENSRSLIC
jgi:hypothetical protein